VVQLVIAEQIVQLLHTSQPVTVDEAKSLVPSEPGFYAWWIRPGALPEVPSQPHPVHPVDLLYAGIAPSRDTSTSSLRTRICGQHIGGNIASSTFRFGLAALLSKREGWVPVLSDSGKVSLILGANKKLSQWQIENLRVAWTVVEEPWRFECDVIQLLRPPMNREFNQQHPFYASIGAARAELRQAATHQT
jgi:hypothetical protein